MSYVVFVAPEDSSQADTIIVGPYKSLDRAERALARIERLYGDRVACMIMPCVPDTRIGLLGGMIE